MALTFNMGDLANLASLARGAPDPHGFWSWVITKTTNNDLIEVARKMRDDWNTAATNPLSEQKRQADAVQELQGFEHRIELVRQQDTGQGMTVEAQLVETVAMV